MRGYYGTAKRNQPVRLDPLNPRKAERFPASSDDHNDPRQDGFARLSHADPETGIRQPVGGEPVFPPYHEDP